MAAEISLGKIAGKPCYVTPQGVKFTSRGKVRPYNTLLDRSLDGQVYAVPLNKGAIRKIRKGLRAQGMMKELYSTLYKTRTPRRGYYAGMSIN